MIRILRIVVGTVVAVYLLLGPAVPQVLKKGHHWFPSWVMFTGFGIDLCSVTLTDGTTGAPIDRLGALGYARWTEAPASERTLKDLSAVSRQVKTICKKQKLTDVRVDARCGVERGWVHVATGKENACVVNVDGLAEGREVRRPFRKKTTGKKQP